jgi:predicted negative regulator of RcsB-dependent stress response
MKKHLQNGFGHLGSLLLVVIVVLIALIGYKVYNNSRNNTVAMNNTPASSSQKAQKISNTGDLNSAESTLNSQNIDSDLNPDSLNQDVQNLL